MVQRYRKLQSRILHYQRGIFRTIHMLQNRDIGQLVDHKTEKEMSGTRNMLVESARIARGKVDDIKEFKGDADYLCIPGGYGVARNLSTFADLGPDCSVDPDVAKWIRHYYDQKKPIIGVCIAPGIISKVLTDCGVSVTMGTDSKSNQLIEKMGNKGVLCKGDDACIDRENRIYTCPGYMIDDLKLSEMHKSLQKAVAEL